MATGTVKWFSRVKRYGFVAPADGGTDVLLHYSELEKAGYDGLLEGTRISFDVGTHLGRPCAIDLTLRRD